MKHLSFFTFLMASLSVSQAYPSTVFFGTSGGRDSSSKGIYATSFETTTGKLGKPARLVARIDSPGFLTQHPTLQVLYSTGQSPDSGEAVIAAYSISSKDGQPALQNLNAVPTGCGQGSHLKVHRSGKWLATAHYGSGSVAVFPLKPDGRLENRSQMVELQKASKANPARQGKPHPHSVNFDSTGRFLLVADLGADRVYVFRFDAASGTLTPHFEAPTAPGTGPRHLTFSPDDRFVYLVNELSLTVDSFEWDSKDGQLKRVSSIRNLPEETTAREVENTASEIQVSRDGFHVYVGNRGNDSLSVFKADPYSGHLERMQIISARAAWPRHFSLDPSGKWLVCAGQDSNNVGVFAVEPEFGTLQYQPQSSINVPAPICILFAR